MIPAAYARPSAAVPLDLAKRDLPLTLGGRTFAVRASLDRRASDGPGWQAVIIEDRTPINHGLVPTDDPEECLAAAARFLAATIAGDAADLRQSAAWESEGGALAGPVDRRSAPNSGTERGAAS